MPDTPVPLTPRIIPGAPPSAPVTKTQKKKRKGVKTKEESDAGSHVAIPDTASAALIEKAPEEIDIKEGVVAPQLVAETSEDPQTPVTDAKPSPIVEMLNKRLRANGKKITRIQSYQNESPEKLNEDQKRLLKTLPVLEAVSRELEEVKKAIEVHESEVAQELAFSKAEVARAEAERIRETVAAKEEEYLSKTAELVTFLRLHTMLSNRHPEALALNLSDAEGIAIYSITETLFHHIAQGKGDMIRSFFTGEGEHHGVPYTRIQEIQQQFLNPSTVQAAEILALDSVVEDTTSSVVGVPPSMSTSGGIHFIMTDELAGEEVGPDTDAHADNGDWVDVEGAVEADQPTNIEITETTVEADVNGHAVVEESITVTTTTEVPSSSQLNWADEDHGDLPSLANLQAHYGTSTEGSSAPEPDTTAPEIPSTPQLNGPGRLVDEEGFTQHRGRGRGRGFRGERGSARGSFRGDHEGGRGGRGGRGGFRGGDRGFRGRPDGEWRGGRGGRGRGRGFHEGRGAAPPAAT